MVVAGGFRAHLTGVFSYTRVRGGRLRVGMTLGLVGLVALTAVGFGLWVKPATATAAAANTVNFQARLETASGSIAQDGNYNVRFKLYNVSTGGSALWTETYLVSASQGVRTANGYLTANLGTLTAFPSSINWGQQIYLTMEIGGTGTSPTWDGEMSPRLSLTSVPSAFALNSYNGANGFSSSLSILQPTGGNQTFQIQDQGAAGTYNVCIAGSTSCGFAPTSGGTGYIQNQSASAQVSSNFWISGTGKAATALQAPSFDSIAAGNLNIGTTNATSITLGKAGVNTIVAGNLSVGTTSSYGAITIANGAWLTALDSAGTGYVNMLSVNTNNEIQVGAALNIDGGIVLPTDGGQMTLTDLPISSSALAGTAQSYTLRVGSTNALTVYGEADGTGNAQNVRVAIGSSITPAYTLDVGGTGRFTDRVIGADAVNTNEFATLGQVNAVVGGGSGNGNYIQNQNAAAQTSANFWISGTGKAASGILAPTMDTLTAGALGIGGTTATSITIGRVGVTTTVAGGLIVNGTASFGSTVQVAGDLQAGNQWVRSVARTVPTVVGDAVDIGNFNVSSGARTLDVSIVVSSGGFSVAKRYIIPIQYNATSNVWNTVQPISDSGAYSGNDYALDINVNTNVASLRIRRVSGATAGTAGVTIVQQGISTDAFTASSATASVATPSALLTNTSLTQINGRVGIGTLAPAYPLDVQGGSINTSGGLYTSGALRVSSTGAGTLTTLSLSGVLTSTVATGTAPFTVASTTKVNNLNADLLDGLDSSAFCQGTCVAGGSASGDLTGTYPNPTIAKLQGSTLTITSPASGNILQFNGTAWVNQAVTGDISIAGTGVASITAGTIVNADLAAGSFTNITGVGTLGSLSVTNDVSIISGGLVVNGTTVLTNGRTLQSVTYQGGTIAVGYGGTGQTSFTQYGVLFGNNTSAMGVTAAGSTGQCLVATTGGAPSWSSCAGAGSGVTLQSAYNNGLGGTTPEIVLDSSRTTLDIQAYSGQTADLLNLRAYAALGLGVSRFSVSAAGLVTAAGGLTVSSAGADITGGINNNSDGISNTGSLSGVTGITTTGGYTQSGASTNSFTGAISSTNTITGTTLNGTTGINTGAGAGTQRIDASGNLTNIGSYTGSGNITTTGGTLNIQGTGTNSISGWLGIGTTDPIAALHVVGGTVTQIDDLSTAYITAGEYQNHLLRTAEFENASWVATSVTKSAANAVVGPMGDAIAESLTATAVNGTVTQAITNSTTGDWNFSIWLRASSGTTTAQIGVDSSAQTGTYKTVTLDTTWRRFAVTQNFSTAHTTKTVKIVIPTSGAVIQAWGAQLDNNSFARGYFARSTAAQTTTARSIELRQNTNIGGSLYVAGNLSLSGAVTSVLTSRGNSAVMLSVQNSNSVPVFNVSTMSNTVNRLTNPGFEVNTTGWANITGGTLTRQTTLINAYNGVASGQIVTTATANAGARTTGFNTTVAAGTYTLSFYAKVASGTFTTLTAGYNQGAADVPCTLNNTTVLTTGFKRFSCTFTSTANMASIYVGQSDATARTIYLDSVQLEAGSNVTPYHIGEIQLRGVISSPVSFRSGSDSTSAFQIQNAAGNSNLFVADTINGRIGIGTAAPGYALDVQGGDINTAGDVMTAGVARISSTGAGTLTTLSLSGVLTSTVATGTAPLSVASTTKVDNLNADLLDGLDSSAFCQGSCSASGTAGGDLTGSYPNPTIAGLQGSLLTINTPVGGNILQFNGTAWVNQSVSGDITISSTGVAAIAAGSIVNADLATGTFGNITGLGTQTFLNVSGATTLSGSLTLNGAADVSALNPGVSGTAALIQGPQNSHMVFDLRNNDARDAFAIRYSAANNTTVDTVGLVFNGSGALGVGTNNPGQRLDIQGGNINTSGNLMTGGTTRISSAGAGTLTSLTVSGNVLPSGHLNGTQNLGGVGNYWGGTYTNELEVYNAGNVGISTSGTDLNIGAGKLYVKQSNGYVGIGTTAPASALDVVGAISSRQNNVRTYHDVYSWGTTTTSVTGTLEIILPNTWNNTMLRFQISGYDFSANAAWTAVVSGYNYSATPVWMNTSAEIRGAPAPFSSIRLAYDSVAGKNVLLLGTTSTTWAYPQFSITEVVAGFGNQDAWGSGYSSAFLTSEANITTINSPATQQVAYGQVFLQGGNSFATGAILGTNDNNALTLETNNVNRLSVDTSGNVNILTGALQVGGTTVISSGRVLQNVTYNGGTIAVGYGGTGQTSFTQYGVLFGNNTGGLGATGAGTTGQCLVSTTGGAPAWSTCAGAGSGVTLQSAYNNSLGGTTPEIVLDSSRTTLDVQAYSGQTADLLDLRAYSASGLGVLRFGVSASGAVTAAGALTIQSGGASITGGINNNNGGITNAGNMTGVSGITTSGGYVQSGSTANLLTGATTINNNLTVNGNGSFSGTLTVTGQANLLEGAIIGMKQFGSSDNGTARWAKLGTIALTSAYQNMHATITIQDRFKSSELHIEVSSGATYNAVLDEVFNLSNLWNNGYSTANIKIGRVDNGTQQLYDIWVDTATWSSSLYSVLRYSRSGTPSLTFASNTYSATDPLATGYDASIAPSGILYANNGSVVCNDSGNCGVAAGSNNYIQNTTTVQAGANFNIGANGVIGGTLNVAGDILGNSKIAIRTNDTWLRLNPTNAFTAGIYANTGIFRTDGTLQVGNNGGTLNVVSGGNFAYNTNTLFANTAGNVGIGTITPGAKLEVAGNALITASNTSALKLQDTSSNVLLNADTTNMRLSVGNAAGSAARLHVEGSMAPWTARSAAQANQWRSIVYGNGLFVAVSWDGTNQVMTSPDGITWTARTAAQANIWQSITYGNGLFVAVSQTGTNRVMTSPDGITWTARTAAEANTWISVTYGNGLFVAVAGSGTNRVMTSPDGITWTARTAAQANTWYSVTYGNGLFVAVSGDGTNRVMTSPDGITWTPRSASAVYGWDTITYGNGLFVAGSYDGTNRIMTSPDGVTWTTRTAPEASVWTSITYGNGLFVAVANSGTNRLMTSPDGINWTLRSPAEANNWTSIAYGNGMFVAVANNGTNRVMTSPGYSAVAERVNGDLEVNGATRLGGDLTVYGKTQMNGSTTIQSSGDGTALRVLAAGGGNTLLDINGIGQTTFKNSVDSISAFQIQSSNSAPLFSADTVNNRLTIGSATIKDTIINVVSQTNGTWAAGTYNASSYTTGTAPNAARTADLDGDTDTDIVAVNMSSNTVSILKNNGNGTFATKVDYGTGSSPRSVAIADLDGDGDKDIAVANGSSNTVSILKNNGNGTFATKVDYATASTPFFVAIADLDADGDGDLAVINNSSNSVSILKNNGNGTFATKVDYGTGSSPRSVAIADLDADGDRDLAVANASSNTVSILKNNGPGTYATKVDYAAGTSPEAVVVGDMDNDGDSDVATANRTASTVSVFKNNGAAVLAAAIDYSTGAQPYTLDVADLNADGNADLVVGIDAGMSILTNGGTAVFSTNVDYGTGSTGRSDVTIADIDADNDKDIVLSHASANNTFVFKNLGAAMFGTFAGSAATSVMTADFNGDGLGDLVTRNNGSFIVHLNNGMGMYSSVSYTAAGSVGNAATADIDGDGDQDIVVSNNTTTVSLFKNDGKGAFAAAGTVTFSNLIASIATADLDGDGDQDLVGVGSNSSSGWGYVGLNSGTGVAYSLSTLTSVNAYAKSIAIADLNADGNKDIVIANSNAGTVSVFISTGGSGTFAAKVDYTPTGTITGITLTDINNDGDQDIVTVGTAGLLTMANNGNGTYATALTYSTVANTSSVDAADMNADGYKDIIVGANGTIAVHLNSGLGSYGSKTQYAAGGSSGYMVSVIDGDKDGDSDVAAANAAGGGTMFWNSGNTLVTSVTQNLRANLQVGMSNPNDIGILTQAATGQSANLYQANDSNGNLLTAITAQGKINVGAPVTYSITTVSDGTLTQDAMKATIFNIVSTQANHGPQKVFMEDLDGDSDLDFVTMNNFTDTDDSYWYGFYSFSVYKNNGDGTYAARTDFATGSYYQAGGFLDMAVRDLDGDGDKDFAIIYNSNNSGASTVNLYLNNGTGSYTAGASFATASYANAIALADIDGDGDGDIAVGAQNSVITYKNNGNATFAAGVSISTTGSAVAIKFADLDADGDQDIGLTSNSSSNGYYTILKNSGTGTFTGSSVSIGYNQLPVAGGLTFTDLDADGDTDMAVSLQTSAYPTVMGIYVYKNSGTGTFTYSGSYTGPMGAIINSDIDNDGDQDIIGTGATVFRNDGSGVLSNYRTYYGGTAGTASGDIDGDGDKDLITGYFSSVWTGGTWNTYTSQVYVLTNFGGDSIGAVYPGRTAKNTHVANLNNDTRKDIITNNDTTANVHFRNSNGTYSTTNLYTATSTNYKIIDAQPGDVDGDGDQDVTVAYNDGGNSNLAYFLTYTNNGSGVFTLSGTTSHTYGLVQMLMQDTNGDGIVERITQYENFSSGYGYMMYVYVGTTNIWSHGYNYNNFASIAVADFNNDGNKDLIISGSGTNITVYKNSGTGITTTTLYSNTSLTNLGYMTVADVNNDGWQDLAFAGSSTNALSVFLNSGGTSLAAPLTYTAINKDRMYASDFNGDGSQDILMGSVLHINSGSGNFGSRIQTSISLSTSTLPMVVADMDNDGDMDVVADGSIYWSATGSYGSNSTPMMSVRAASATDGGIFIQAAVNQSAKLFVIQDANGAGLLTVDGKGNLRAKGSITGGVGSPDYAENITVSDATIEAADVVSMDPAKKESVVKSAKPYDETAVGVISTSPGFLTNATDPDASDDTQRPLALSGRVPVKVTNENGVIAEGDYLTTSSTAGYAMKAIKEGHVIGRAMAVFTGTEEDATTCGTDFHCGKVLMFIDNSYYSPVDGNNLQANNMTLFGNLGIGGNVTIGGNVNVGGLATVDTLEVTGNASVQGDLTVKGTATVATLKVGKHILSNSEAPLVAIGSAAGQDGLVTIDGTDVAGTLNITVKARPQQGNTPAETLNAGSLADVTFLSPYEFTPRIVISPTNQTSVGAPVYLVKTATGWQLMTSQPAADGTQYQFDYVIIGSQGQTAAAGN